MNQSIKAYAEKVIQEFDQIPVERKEILQQLALHIVSRTTTGETAKLTFVCTHNSRRSHMSQIWAQTAAYYYGIAGVETYSGGTEATAFNARAVKAMQEAGFTINTREQGENPVYEVTFADDAPAIIAFSKTYDAEGNPQEDFAAIMTCSQADQNCPFIPGASLRISIPYEDPKDFDGTPQEEEQYAARCHQIAREMFYLFSQVNEKKSRK